MPFDLRGRVAVVTGAGRGIGRATALVLASAGSDLVLVGRDRRLLEGVADEIAAGGTAALVLSHDLSEQQAAGQIVRATLERFGRLDVLINNAGVNHAGSIADVDDTVWQQTLATNLDAAFRLCREACAPMRTRRWGRIINVASITAQTGGLSGSVAYSASKGGLLALTRTLARDCAPHGITVNAIAPGQIDTAMTQAMDPAAQARVTAAIPVGRLGTAEDIAYAALYLASEEAGFVTGATLDVNGGMLKR